MSQTDDAPVTLPSFSLDEFSVPVCLLIGGGAGSLRLETDAEISARYADFLANLQVELVADPEKLAAETARVNAACSQELALMQQVREERADDIKTFTFTFRVPEVRDVEGAEGDAALTPPALQDASESVKREFQRLESALDSNPVRLRPAFRLSLARRTLVRHDYPGMPPENADFTKMRSDIAEYVTREVAKRIYFSGDVRSFLSPSARRFSTEAALEPTPKP